MAVACAARSIEAVTRYPTARTPARCTRTTCTSAQHAPRSATCAWRSARPWETRASSRPQRHTLPKKAQADEEGEAVACAREEGKPCTALTLVSCVYVVQGRLLRRNSCVGVFRRSEWCPTLPEAVRRRFSGRSCVWDLGLLGRNWCLRVNTCMQAPKTSQLLQTRKARGWLRARRRRGGWRGRWAVLSSGDSSRSATAGHAPGSERPRLQRASAGSGESAARSASAPRPARTRKSASRAPADALDAR